MISQFTSPFSYQIDLTAQILYHPFRSRKEGSCESLTFTIRWSHQLLQWSASSMWCLLHDFFNTCYLISSINCTRSALDAELFSWAEPNHWNMKISASESIGNACFNIKVGVWISYAGLNNLTRLWKVLRLNRALASYLMWLTRYPEKYVQLCVGIRKSDASNQDIMCSAYLKSRHPLSHS